jgi:hypothetical protein
MSIHEKAPFTVRNTNVFSCSSKLDECRSEQLPDVMDKTWNAVIVLAAGAPSHRGWSSLKDVEIHTGRT